jgi:hypothetical protein
MRAAMLLTAAALAALALAQGAGLPQEVQRVGEWVKAAIDVIRFLFAVGFWASIAVLLYHFILSHLAPTRFQRLGAMWDAIERAKDVLLSWGKLFLLIYAIYAAIGVVSQGASGDALSTALRVFRWIAVDPIVHVFSPAGS